MPQQASKKAVKKVQPSGLSKDVKELHRRYQALLSNTYFEFNKQLEHAKAESIKELDKRYKTLYFNTYNFVIQEIHDVLHCGGELCFEKDRINVSVCTCKCAQCRNGLAFLMRLDRRMAKIPRR